MKATLSKQRFALLISVILLSQVISAFPQGHANTRTYVLTYGRQRQKRYTVAKPSEKVNPSVNSPLQHDLKFESAIALLEHEDGTEVKGERFRRGLKEDVDNEVKKIVAERMDVDIRAVKSKSRLVENLGADTLALDEIVFEIENHFKCKIPDEDAKKAGTVQDLINLTTKLCLK